MLEALKQLAAPAALGEDSIDRILVFARAHLGMDLAWISRTAGHWQVVEYLDGAADRFGVVLGARLPAFPRQKGANPHEDHARRGPAYVVTPLQLPDGRLYGHIACLGERAAQIPGRRDGQFLELVAALLGPSIAALEAERDRRAGLGARVQSILDAGGPTMLFQPICALHDGRPIGYEALARFTPLDRPRTPDQWFADAAEVALGVELEVAAVRCGLAAQLLLPDHLAVSVNVSAAHLNHAAVLTALSQADPHRTIVEITEHDRIDDYAEVRCACEQLRDAGCTIAVDDAGAGYAGFAHLIELRPDIIKLDRQITHHLDTDPARAAMAAALVGFSRALDTTVLAEGVETEAELRAAADLGIHYAQGYYLGRPRPLRADTIPASTRRPRQEFASDFQSLIR